MEHELELAVSRTIRQMPFLVLNVADAAGPSSHRGHIERNAVALLSNFKKPPLDAPSHDWLGHLCTSSRVRESGLWNSNYVDEEYDPQFLDCFARFIGTN
jgi:hypothetical protein